MAAKRKPKRKRKTKRKTTQRGGAVPFQVDFKKGFQLLADKNLWKLPPSSSPQAKKMKQRAAGYKREYRASGTKDSYNSWLVKKGYAKKADANCTIL